MKLRVTILLISSFLLSFILTNAASADCEITLKVRGAHNDPSIANPKKPWFEWSAIEGAENYQLLLNGSIIAAIPGTKFQPDEELAYGMYKGSIKVIYSDPAVDPCLSPEMLFPIGLTPPRLFKPASQKKGKGAPPGAMWNTRPTFEFWGSRGATMYIVAVDGKPVANISADPKKDAKLINMVVTNKDDPSALYKWQPKEGQGFVVGSRHIWVVIAANDYQKVRSDKEEFVIKKLEPPILKEPRNGFKVVVRNESDIPKLVWDHPQRADGIEMEIYFIDPETGKEKPANKGMDLNEFRDAEAMSPGKYKWYVRAYKEDQVSKSEPWEFVLEKPIGLTIGIGVGGNAFKTNNPFAKFRPQPGGFIFIDQRILQKPKFSLKVAGAILLEARTTGFAQDENREFLTVDQHLTNFLIGFDLFFRADFKLMPKLFLYVAAGPEFHLALMKRIIDDGSNYKEVIVSQLKSFGIDIVGALGVYYRFDVNYLFKRKLELGVEFRYTQGVMDYLISSYLGPKSVQTELSLFIINKLIDF